MKKRAFILFVFFFVVSTLQYDSFSQQAHQEKNESVILLHGLSRSNRSMAKLEEELSLHGYNVINVDYPSTKYPVEFLANEVLDEVIEQIIQKTHSKIHFVAHSMGGILVRYYLKHHKLPNLGRVVMLSPPNQGSELVDYMKDSFIFRKIIGPAGLQLGTDKDSIPANLGPVDFELGVITGNRSFNPINSLILPGPDDGVVSVTRARVEGMADFLVMPYSHTFIMQSDDVIDLVVHFLEYGKFKSSQESVAEEDFYKEHE